MVLYHLTTTTPQIGAEPSLYHLTSLGNLEGQLEAFILSCRVDGLSPETIKNYRYQLTAFVRFCSMAGVATPAQVTANHIRLFLLKLRETNNPVSVMDYHKSIKRFFNWLVGEGIIKDSPMQVIKSPRIPQTIVKPFSHQDIENLLLLCSSNSFLDARNKAMVLVFLDTGLRLSELAAIQLVDINFESETIKVMGKGAKERVVRVGKTTQKALLRYLLMRNDSHPCLWITEERRPMTKNGVQITVRVLCQRAGITDAKPGPHTFRHTAAIQCLRNGMGEFTLQIMLGHSTLAMTRKYVSSLGQDDMLRAHRMASPVDNMEIK